MPRTPRVDLSVFQELNNSGTKTPWAERLKLINHVFPTTVRLDWKKVWDQDLELLAELVNDIAKLDQAVPGRPGKRAAVDPSKAKGRLRAFIGDDYSMEPFPETFRAMTDGMSIRESSEKTGFNKALVYRLLKGEVAADAYTMEQVAAAFEKRPEFFLEYRVSFIAGLIADRLESMPEASIHFFRKLHGFGAS